MLCSPRTPWRCVAHHLQSPFTIHSYATCSDIAALPCQQSCRCSNDAICRHLFDLLVPPAHVPLLAQVHVVVTKTQASTRYGCFTDCHCGDTGVFCSSVMRLQKAHKTQTWSMLRQQQLKQRQTQSRQNHSPAPPQPLSSMSRQTCKGPWASRLMAKAVQCEHPTLWTCYAIKLVRCSGTALSQQAGCILPCIQQRLPGVPR